MAQITKPARWTENDEASNEGEGLRLEDLDAAFDKEMSK